jgi:phosphopantetheinyl transferase
MTVCSPNAETARIVPESHARADVAEVGHRYSALEAFDTFDALLASGCKALLSDRERAELAAWHDPERRRSWLAGRLLAKQVVRETWSDAPVDSAIEILSLNDRNRGSRPRVVCDGQQMPWSLSISHTQRGVLVALSTAPNVSVGVDLAAPQKLSAGFVRLWFTPAEQQWLAKSTAAHAAATIWAAKEALFKACNRGEGFTPRMIEVLPDGNCSYQQISLPGCWRSWSVDKQIAVLATVKGDHDPNFSSR